MEILVTYSSKHGSTAEIAHAIADTLTHWGHATTLLPVSKVERLDPYRAVVIGSAVYIGMWCKDAEEFLIYQEAELKRRHVWIFSSGPTKLGNPISVMGGWYLPKSLRAAASRIDPHDTTVFRGCLKRDELSALEIAAIQSTSYPITDARDWDVITQWARSISYYVRAAEWHEDEQYTP